MPTRPFVPDRRSFLAAGAGSLALPLAATPATATGAVRGRPPRLTFDRTGHFRILQVNDTQDGATIDARTVELITRAIAEEHPHLIIFVGDNLDGSPRNRTEAMQALHHVIGPVEAAGIPWAAQFGNHDEDSTAHTGWGEAEMLRFFQRFPHNVNPDGPRGVTGTGNGVLTVRGRDGRPAYRVWLLDAGRYAPKRIAGQDLEGYPHWDWVRPDQIEWYLETSRSLEHRDGRLVPGLLFQHIALWEHRFMWFASVDRRTAADHERAVTRHHITGERNEDECPGPFNSGLYAALQHRGDVRGVFVGHDHVNTYVGNYYGIELGYGPATGFGPYGLGGGEDHRLRGCRVFDVGEDGTHTSRLVFARDLDIDVSAGRVPLPPGPLPRWAG